VRTFCFVLGLFSLAGSMAAILAGLVGLQGAFGVDLGSNVQWAALALVSALAGIAWMVGAVAFRPDPLVPPGLV